MVGCERGLALGIHWSKMRPTHPSLSNTLTTWLQLVLPNFLKSSCQTFGNTEFLNVKIKISIITIMGQNGFKCQLFTY